MILAATTPFLLFSFAFAAGDSPRIGGSEIKARSAGSIRLATYNVENLFDEKDDPALSGAQEDKDNAKPVEHLKALAATIRAIDADVIALEEIESKEALVGFRDEYLKGLGYEYVESFDAGDSRGIENAVISRFPLRDTKIWLHMPLEGAGHPEIINGKANAEFGKAFDFRRSPLRVTVEVPAEKAGAGKPYALTLFVVHHKSSAGFGYWREAEAKRVLELVHEFEESDSSANVAMLGDFNALPQDESVQAYARAGMIDVFADRTAGDSGCLTHASNRTIDYIFVNSNLRPELLEQSRFIFATPQLASDADWRTAPKPAGYASDHLPVVVDIVPRDK